MRPDQLSRRAFISGAAGTTTCVAGLTTRRAAARTFYPQAGDKPAILGGTPIRKEPYPSWPIIDQTDEKLFLDALRRKEWCRLNGNSTTSFEE